MKFGVIYHSAYHGADPDTLVAFATQAEAFGFESFYLPEHVALAPGAILGAAAVDPALPIVDPVQALGLVAAVTERILLGTAVLQLPYHHPVTLAKRLATLDVLSRGRLRLLTIGLGPIPLEAEATGVDFATRGRRADEAMDVLRLLWAGDENGVSHSGEFFSFTDLCVFPKPHEARTLPIHVAGSSRAAARRAGRRGDGFFPGGGLDDAERARRFELMRATAREAGRDPAALEYTRWGSTDLSADAVAAHAVNGVTRLVVSAGARDPQALRDELSAFAERHGLG